MQTFIAVVYICGSCGAEFAFALVFEKINVTIQHSSHLSETKSDDLAISSIDIFGTKNVKCDDGYIITFWTNER